LEIQDKKGVENLVADHLSRIEQEEENSNEFPIDDAFPDEYLLSITANLTPWYVPFTNFFACGVLPPDLSFQGKKKFLVYVKYNPILYKYCVDQIVHRCVPENEMESTLHHCHAREVGGHFGASKTTTKVLQSGFCWPTLFKDAYAYVKACDAC